MREWLDSASYRLLYSAQRFLRAVLIWRVQDWHSNCFENVRKERVNEYEDERKSRNVLLCGSTLRQRDNLHTEGFIVAVESGDEHLREICAGIRR